VAKLHLIKTPAGLHGMTEPDHEAWLKFKAWLDKLQPGECIKLEYSKPRNLKNHRRFFALLSVVAEYSDIYDNVDKALVAVKIAAGHCDFEPNPITGELQAIPRSISWSGMDDEDDFKQFFNNAIQGVLTYILPALDEASLNAAVDKVIRF
jgi:hypothetical protein